MMLPLDPADRVLLALAKLKYELRAARFLRATERLIAVLRKANFDPNQPRVPAGNPDGGQWTGVGGGAATAAGRNDPRVISDATPDNDWKPGTQLAQNRPRGGGGIRTINGRPVQLTPAQALRLDFAIARAQAAIRRVQRIDPDWRPPQSFHSTVDGAIAASRHIERAAEARLRELGHLADDPVTKVPPIRLNERPGIPSRRPTTTREANKFVKQAARWLVTSSTIDGLSLLVEAGSWIYDYYPYVASYLDPPRTLQELQAAVSKSVKGYDIHHVVEQTPAEKDGLPRWLIDSPENRVRIPTLKHWEITGWYATKNKDYGNRPPREYLRDKDWEERRRVGRLALIKFGVLQP